MSLIRVTAVLGVVGACGKHAAPPSGPDDLTAAVEAVRATEKLPALGMAVWKHGTLVAQGVSGQRKSGGDGHPVTFDDQWHLGSDTKAMTATLIGIYVDKGVLHWSDTIPTLFPGELIDSAYATVTLDQLLQHRGGAPSDPSDELWNAMYDNKPDARLTFVRAILEKPPAQAPGTFAYSNAGYMIAGAALERATKLTWEQLITRDLFTPLHMTSCGFGAPGSATAIDQPWGHMPDGKPVTPGLFADNPPGIGPAGSVHCSLGDWGKFLSLHAEPSSPLVSAATFAHLHTPPPGTSGQQAYMGGWMIATLSPTGVRFAHEGSNTMWHAIAVVMPATDVAVAVVANKFDPGLFTALGPLMKPYLKQ